MQKALTSYNTSAILTTKLWMRELGLIDFIFTGLGLIWHKVFIRLQTQYKLCKYDNFLLIAKIEEHIVCQN